MGFTWVYDTLPQFKQDSYKVTGDLVVTAQKGVEHFINEADSLVSVEYVGGGRN